MESNTCRYLAGKHLAKKLSELSKRENFYDSVEATICDLRLLPLCVRFRLLPGQSKDLQLLVAGYKDETVRHYRNQIRIAIGIRPVARSRFEQRIHWVSGLRTKLKQANRGPAILRRWARYCPDNWMGIAV